MAHHFDRPSGPTGPSGGREPIFNDIPPVLVGLAAVICAISILAFVAPPALQALIFEGFGVGERARRAPLSYPLGYLAHVFVHGGIGHLAMNMIIAMAVGRGVAKRFGSTRRGAIAFLVLFFVCAIAGAATQVVFDSLLGRGNANLIGASTAVSGLVAAAMYVLRSRPGRPLPSMLSQTYASAVAPWFLLNLVPAAMVAVAPGAFGMLAGIAWMAHVGGLLGGAIIFPVLDLWVRGAGQAHRPGDTHGRHDRYRDHDDDDHDDNGPGATSGGGSARGRDRTHLRVIK